MPRLSKKLKDIWEFFIDPITGKRKYFTRCLACARKCKQSFRVKEVDCPRYEPKRAKAKKEITTLSAEMRMGRVKIRPILKTARTTEESAENGT